MYYRPRHPEDGHMTDAQIRQLLIDRVDIQRKSVGMVVGIITPDRRSVVSHGCMSQESQRPVDGDTAFEIASVTKAFTSLVLADMVQRGEVALDDPVSTYLPAGVTLPERNGRRITLVDLATHTSGVPPQPPDLQGLDDPAAAEYSLDRLYQSLATYRLIRDIGSEWEYSNVDMALLGHALARRAGTDYETLVRARITGPLGMTSTSTVVSPELAPRVAVSHDSDLRPTTRLSLGALGPAGAMLSSANDLLALLGALLELTPSPLAPAVPVLLHTRRPIYPPIVKMLQRHWRLMLRAAVSRRNGRRAPARFFSRAEQALGWYILGRGGDEMVVHDGSGPSCAASVVFDRKARAGVVVLSNAGIMVQDVARHLLWSQYPLGRVRTEVALDPAVLDRYVGDYTPLAGPGWNILRDGDRLLVKVPYYAKLHLRPENAENFFVPELDFEFSFDRDAHDRVTQLVFRPGKGQPDMPARKQAPTPST